MYFFKHVRGITISTQDVPAMKVGKRLPEFFTLKEMRTILAKTNNYKHRLMMETLMACGLRLSELQQLHVKDLILGAYNGKSAMRVRSGKGDKDRMVLIPDDLAAKLAEYTHDTDCERLVFLPDGGGKKYPKRTIQKICNAACKRAGVSGRWNVHKFRATYASQSLLCGANVVAVQKAMGHKSLKTTSIYLDVTLDHMLEMPDIVGVASGN